MSNSNSELAPGQNKLYSIVVNGRPRQVADHKLTYQQVVKLAYPDDPANPDILYNVSYANPHGRDGVLVDGQDVTVKDGMIFNVSKTNRS